MNNSVEEFVQSSKYETTRELKKSAFDLVAIAIVAALVLAALDVFDLVDVSLINIGDFVISWVPYFLATILLTQDLYKKGVFVGKSTTKFASVTKAYSDLVNNLSGKQVEDLQPFCEDYNEKALISIRRSILKEEGIAYECFDKEFIYRDVTYKALKTMTKKELIDCGYNEVQIKAIRKAKKAKVKGINVNILLSSANIADPTNLGKGEADLGTRKLVSSILIYVLSTFLMSLIAIKDIATWGWASLITVLFKVIYMFARSFMSYFDGYDDITISVSNHIMRKTDILKMYLDYKPTEQVDD